MTRQAEREARSKESPVIGSLPDAPGIVAAMRISPGLATHLRGLADELLVHDFPGSTLTRAERELIATAVSAGNDCFYCMDSHGAFAQALSAPVAIVDDVKSGKLDGVSAKVRALIELALGVRKDPRAVTRAEAVRALEEGATDADTQLGVLIAAAFCMYNRIVEGFRAPTPPSATAYDARAAQIAEHGYSDARVQALPGR